ncbi:MAG: hypothetical protein AAGE89_11275 [Pseudomonadota bacterium]
MPTAVFQPSFGGGVLGPGLHARLDTQKYDVGLKVGKNVFVHVHGGVSNRAGTEFVCEVIDHSYKHRLIPFERDVGDSLVLVMGQNQMKVIEAGSVVQSGGSDYLPSTPYTAAQIDEADYTQSIDVIFFAQEDVHPKRMSRFASDNISFADVEVDPSVDEPTIKSVESETGGNDTYKYKVSGYDGDVEGFASPYRAVNSAQDLDEQDAQNTITWTGSAQEYNVYRERNGVYGYIGYTTEKTFIDDNISPDLTIAPIEYANVFSGAGYYPRSVAKYQQRIFYGGSRLLPETVWASRTGDFSNFTKSRVLRDTDRIEMDITGDALNSIRYMVALRELVVFTTGGEFTISGPDNVLLATNPIQTPQSFSGCHTVKPIVVEDTVLYVDRTGNQVRDLRYAFEQDGYTGNDLTVFAFHYFEGRKVTGWAYAKNPYSLIWVHLDDGTLLSLTYKREHRVWAWTEHDLSGGFVESLCVVPEGNRDVLYLSVRRTVNGQEKRYVERMRDRRITDISDAFFVDCGVTYDGAPITTITGLDHLEGKRVAALADGNVVEDMTVTGGEVVLPRAASKVHIGLPFEAEIETLPPAIDLQDVGSARGRPHSISKARVQLDKTRGIAAGTDRDRLEEIVQTGTDLTEPIAPFTGMMDLKIAPNWTKDGTLVVRQRYPLPMTVLGIAPEVSIGRSN